MGRFHVEPNGAGGWETRDRKDGNRAVCSSAFRFFCEGAKGRLDASEPDDEWRKFYGVKS